MPFKIVQQQTQNGPVLLAVPDKWEKEEYLHWPSHLSYNQRRKLRKNDRSSPDDKWAVQRCKLRATGLNSFREAEEQIDEQIELSENAAFVDSDTDEEEVELANEVGKRRKLETAGDCLKAMPDLLETSKRAELRRFVEAHRQHQEQQRAQLQILPLVEVKQEILIDSDGESNEQLQQDREERPEEQHQQTQHRQLQWQQQPRRLTLPYFDPSSLCTDDDILNHKVDTLLSAVSNIGLVLDSVAEAISLVNGKVEEIARKAAAKRAAPATAVRPIVALGGAAAIAAADTSAIAPMPIDNANDAKDINQKLKDDTIFKGLWLNYLTKKFGKNGQYMGDGVACAHQLIDRLFTRRFLMQCTWSGSVALGLKFAFKEYRNIIDMFHTALKFADPTVTMDRVENFFRAQLANSAQRPAPPKEGGGGGGGGVIARQIQSKRRSSPALKPVGNAATPSDFLDDDATLDVADGVSRFRGVIEMESVG